ncbi:MAG TPA: hypothetical protein VIU15_16935 [Streptomyces sp.]
MNGKPPSSLGAVPHGTGAAVVYDVPRGILPLLGLPERDTLTDARQRGAKCTWCAITLTATTVIDLGEQHEPDGVWFPRACRSCVSVLGRRALRAHLGICEPCGIDRSGSACEVATALWKLTEAHR